MSGGTVTEAWWKHYRLRSRYLCDKLSPFDSSNMRNHAITIRNTKLKRQIIIQYWPSGVGEVIQDERRLVQAWSHLVMTALLCSQGPEKFCQLAGLDPRDEAYSRPRYEAALDATTRVFQVLGEDIMTTVREMKQQGLLKKEEGK